MLLTMIKRLIGFGVIVCLLFCFYACKKKSTIPPVVNCNPAQVGNIDYAAATNLNEFAARIEEIRKAFKIPGMSAAVAKGPNIIWAQGFGYSNVAQQKEARPDTCFRIASLTKTFASTIIMQFVEAGLLDLDTLASEFGISLPNSDKITVRHLFTHTSEGEPGAAYAYNGSRFALLDNVVRQLSGKTFAQQLQDVIIDPLQLTHTAPCTSSQASSLNLAQGYCPSGERTVPYRQSFSSAAGLLSTVQDYLKYSIAVDANRFLTAATMADVFTPMVSNSGTVLPYGLGWFVETVDDRKVVWHYGWWDGTSTLIVKVPEKELAFVIMANTDMLSRPFFSATQSITNSSIARFFLAGGPFYKRIIKN